jgi:hypothetical protein
MPDPRVLYIVTAVVVLALVVWVVVVLARPLEKPRAAIAGTETQPSNAPPAHAKAADGDEKVSQPSRAAESLRQSRPRLDSHLEIQDQPEERDKGSGEA